MNKHYYNYFIDHDYGGKYYRRTNRFSPVKIKELKNSKFKYLIEYTVEKRIVTKRFLFIPIAHSYIHKAYYTILSNNGRRWYNEEGRIQYDIGENWTVEAFDDWCNEKIRKINKNKIRQTIKGLQK